MVMVIHAGPLETHDYKNNNLSVIHVSVGGFKSGGKILKV